jgi:putative ATP-dependent endonuclease of OLD family
LTVYGRIYRERAKTETAYRLGPILETRFTPDLVPAPAGELPAAKELRLQENAERTAAKQQELREALPNYLVAAIDYVTRNDPPAVV